MNIQFSELIIDNNITEYNTNKQYINNTFSSITQNSVRPKNTKSIK